MKPLTAEWIAKAEADFAVAYRYPGESADRRAALEARERCRRVRLIVRAALGLGRASR